jgi:hypothetical protein
MRNRNALALLLAPVVFLALLFFTADNTLQASPHDDRYYRDGGYARSVAVVWSLDSIKDGVNCHDAIIKYEREVGGGRHRDRYGRDYDRGFSRSFGSNYRDAIAYSYEDLAGACTDHRPHAAARDQAAAYLAGMKVTR